MAYLVKKLINKKPYYYLRQSKRINNKVISKNIAYFGKIKPTEKQIEERLAQIKETVVPKNVVPKEQITQISRDVVPKEKLYKTPLISKAMDINEMAVFCKQKGFIYQNSSIYGGFSGFFDYAHLGVELKNNIKQAFWKEFVSKREDVVGIDGSIITHPKVWEASGHVDSFTDYIYKCDKCKLLLKGDDDKGMKCPNCSIELKTQGKFNLMFSTQVGPVAGQENIAYLRPETAQVIFTNFKLVMDSARKKPPFGIAQLGKAFRNEISPRDFLFRSREFEQFEIEFFTNPDKANDCPYIKGVEDIELQVLTAENQNKKEDHGEMTIKQLIDKKITTQWHAYWLAQYYKFFIDYGIRPENLRLREHLKDELAHYASACFDIEYRFPFGWKEIHGNADRRQFDLKQHMKFSNTSLEYFDEEKKEKVIPYVASEPSQGIDRAFLAFLFDAYNYDKERGNIVLILHPKLAPVKVGVFPLVNKLNDKARHIFNELKSEFICFYDSKGSIGRRYARQDEIGTPICITIDFQTQEDSAVTLRDRNTTQQTRVNINKLKEELAKIINYNDYSIFKK